jgi:chromosome segregation ATPase
MNLAGKILTVSIFIFSVIFMTLVLAIYVTHTNWRDEIERTPEQAAPAQGPGLKYVWDEEKKHNQELKDRLEQLTQDRDRERSAKVQALTKLENENSFLKDRLAELQKSIDKYEASERELTAAIAETQENSAESREKMESLQNRAADAKKLRNENFNEVVRLTDELHQLLNELSELKVRNSTLTADAAKYKQALEHFDVTEKNK